MKHNLRQASLILTPSCCSLPLAVEIDSSNGEAKIVLLCEFAGAKAITRAWRRNRCPTRLLEQDEHKPMDADIRPWHFIAHHLSPYIRSH